MVSSALSRRRSPPRPPVVCLPPPKDPAYPLILDIWVNPWIIPVGSKANVWWFGDNATRPKWEQVESVWDWGTVDGYIVPPTLNREIGEGLIDAPQYPGKTQITVKSTWGDGSVAFASRDVYFILPTD